MPPAPLPAGVERLNTAQELSGKRWEVLSLTAAGCQALQQAPEVVCVCGTVLLPDEWGDLTARQIRAERVISCGLSSRDSLTLSSMGEEETVVCLQRVLTRPDGTEVEPQELPMGCLSDSPEDLLAVVGLGLLL